MKSCRQKCVCADMTLLKRKSQWPCLFIFHLDCTHTHTHTHTDRTCDLSHMNTLTISGIHFKRTPCSLVPGRGTITQHYSDRERLIDKNHLQSKWTDLLYGIMRAARCTKKQMSISALLKGELLRSLKPISANVQMSSWQIHRSDD